MNENEERKAAAAASALMENAEGADPTELTEPVASPAREQRAIAFSPERIKKQLATVCDLMRLDPSWQCRRLSGGQKQRLITASVLAMGQRIILLDEPLANLDTAGAELLMTTLRALADAGYCVVVIEHRLDMVLPFVNRVLHVGNRQVREVSDPAAYLREQSAPISDRCPAFMGGEALLSLSDVAFSVRDRKVLDGVTFDIPRGSRTVLLGENGCGKTTLLRLIARLEKPTRGRIRQLPDPRFGQGTRGGREWYRRVGVVYQNPDYQLFMPTVEREVRFGARSDAYADEVAEAFGVRSLYARHPQSLSEGQKRRVSIAAVAATAPELLILDEPTVGQDYRGLCDMVEVLNRIHTERGTTLLTVTHDRRCAEALCDVAVRIGSGVAQEVGGKELVRAFFGG
ncbi:MAG TPA: hypothetical protein DDW30_00470 [Clostridiales bacterium]|nr:hypothetical protein [Clostridiales bacterium]